MLLLNFVVIEFSASDFPRFWVHRVLGFRLLSFKSFLLNLPKPSNYLKTKRQTYPTSVPSRIHPGHPDAHDSSSSLDCNKK